MSKSLDAVVIVRVNHTTKDELKEKVLTDGEQSLSTLVRKILERETDTEGQEA